MPANWGRFFCQRVPVVLVLLVLMGQALALALRHVPLRRSYMDDLALAVERDHTSHRVVLLGDSITLNSTRRFQLGRGPQDVANLATIGWTGAAAELFLLQRYLANHASPQYVIYASAMDDLDNHDGPRLIHYYDWNVYTKPAERAFMRHTVPGIDARRYFPAVLDVQEEIFERMLSLTALREPHMPSGQRAPDPDVQPEPATENRMSAGIRDQRIAQPLLLGRLEQAVLRQICELGRRYGFQVRIVWPPLPPMVREAWRRDGRIDALNGEIAAIDSPACRSGATFDVNTVRSYTNFNRDGFHLHGPLWEERYAADLSDFIARLPDRPTLAAAFVQPRQQALRDIASH